MRVSFRVLWRREKRNTMMKGQWNMYKETRADNAATKGRL